MNESHEGGVGAEPVRAHTVASAVDDSAEFRFAAKQRAVFAQRALAVAPVPTAVAATVTASAAAAAAAAADAAADYSTLAASVASHLQLMASPMKTDGFLDWASDTDSLLPKRYGGDPECPCCQMPVPSLHAHTPQCFLSRFHAAEASPAAAAASGEACVDEVQASIGCLDLRTRLAVMESLYRLSKSEGDSAGVGGVSAKADAHDVCVLGLLYGALTGPAAARHPHYSLGKVFAAPDATLAPLPRLSTGMKRRREPGETLLMPSLAPTAKKRSISNALECLQAPRP